MTRQSRIYEDPVDSSLRNIGVIPVYDPPLEEMQRRRKRAGRRWPEGAGGEDDIGQPPTGIGLESLTVPELTPGAIIGDVSVEDPDPGDMHTLSIDDVRFEFNENTLKLKDDQQLVFADAATVRVLINALDSTGKSISVYFDLEVVQSANLAPTDITLTPSNPSFNEQSPGVSIAAVAVNDPNAADSGQHTFVVSDIRFEVVDQVLRLKSGQEIIFATEPVVNLSITAIDPGLLSVTVNFQLAVIEGNFPEPNNEPTDVFVSPTTVRDSVFGYVVGTVTVIDADLPADTMHLTVDDNRFVIIGDVLRLKPTQRISLFSESFVPITITATDSAGATVSRTVNMAVVPVEEPPDMSNAVFVTPLGAGSNSGSSFANARPWSGINAAIVQAAAEGKQVLMASHLGNYTSGLRQISAGGTAGNRVKVWGCDASGNATDILIVGTRTNPFVWPMPNNGGEVFRFITGANHLHFRNITFLNCGAGCFRIANDITDLVIENCGATNVRRFIDNLVTGGAPSATWTGGLIRNCSVRGYSRGFARFQYFTNNISLENCFGDSERQQGDDFPVGVGIYMDAHDITHTDCEMRNNWGPAAPPTPDNTGANPNGDGFSSEGRTYNLKWVRCRATGNMDGGFDLKSGLTDTIPHEDLGLVDCWAADNKKNYRLWREQHLLRCVGTDPNSRDNHNINQSQVHLPGIPPSLMPHVVLTDCAFTSESRPALPHPVTGNIMDCVFDPSTIQTVDATATLDIINTSVQKHPDTPYENPGHQATVTGIPDEIMAPPTIVVAPVISGTGVAGEPLEVTAGTWNVDVTPFYQWLRDGDYIDDARGAIYIPVTADIGAVTSCRVFGKSAAGYMGSVTVVFGGSIGPAIPVNTALPTISGIRAVDGVLTASTGTWTGEPAPTFTYRWTRDGVDISAATNPTYTLVTADVGTLIRIRVTATNSAGAVQATSDPTAAIGAAGSQTTFFIRPTAAGTQDGASWANAVGGLASLNGVLAAAAPAAAAAADPIVYLRADEGAYIRSSTLTLNKSGSPGHHITIRGVDVDLAPMKAEIQGGRTAWTQQGVGTLTNPFATTNGSPIVTVTHVGHGLVMPTPPAIRVIQFDGATAVGGITIDAGYILTSVIDPDTYTITHRLNATSDATGGGSVDYDYEIVTNVSNWIDGTSIFTLIGSSNYLTFEYLNFVRCGDGCFKMSGAAHDLTIRNIDFYNIKRFFEMNVGQVGNTNITIRDISGVGFSECFARCRGFANNWLIKNINVNSARQNGDNFAIGIDGSEDSFNITIEDVVIRNCHDTVSSYWNGDGIKNEGRNHDWTFTRVECYGCTDGGFDLKGYDLVMTDCIAGSNKKNFRFWGEIVCTNPISIEPVKRGGTSGSVHFHAPSWFRSHVILDAPVLINSATSGASRYNVDSDAQLFIKNEDVSGSLAGGDSVATGSTLIRFDDGDNTPPTILGPHNIVVDHLTAFARELVADEPVIWKLIGGADFALFGRDYTTLSMAAKDFSTPVDANTNGVYEVQVEATDAGQNVVTQTFTVTVLAPRWTPVALGTQLSAWWKADDLPDTAVVGWTDSVQSKALTAAGPPVKSSTSFNSAHPGVTFTGDDFFATTSLVGLPRGATAGEIWAIADATGAGANLRLICAYGGTGGVTNRSIGRAADHAARAGDGGTALTDGSHLDFTGFSIIGGSWDGTTMGGRRDGRDFEPSATTTIATLATGNTGRFRIGANTANTAAAIWVGVVRHVIIISGLLSQADRERMEGFLAWDSGLESLLPVSHPYKSAAP